MTQDVLDGQQPDDAIVASPKPWMRFLFSISLRPSCPWSRDSPMQSAKRWAWASSVRPHGADAMWEQQCWGLLTTPLKRKRRCGHAHVQVGWFDCMEMRRLCCQRRILFSSSKVLTAICRGSMYSCPGSRDQNQQTGSPLASTANHIDPDYCPSSSARSLVQPLTQWAHRAEPHDKSPPREAMSSSPRHV